jgi:hypothetical protein
MIAVVFELGQAPVSRFEVKFRRIWTPTSVGVTSVVRKWPANPTIVIPASWRSHASYGLPGSRYV